MHYSFTKRTLVLRIIHKYGKGLVKFDAHMKLKVRGETVSNLPNDLKLSTFLATIVVNHKH